jgi:hypothetical protein
MEPVDHNLALDVFDSDIPEVALGRMERTCIRVVIDGEVRVIFAWRPVG